MKDYMDLGSSPAEEDAAQLGSYDYELRASDECKRFIDLIRKKLGTEPEGAKLFVKRNSHDFGNYLTVVCKYDDASEAAVEYAFRCENEAPTKWDTEREE